MSLALLVFSSVWLWGRPATPIIVKPLPLTAAKAIEPPPAAARARPIIDLQLSASPPGARLWLDGAPLPTNPFHGHVPADDRLHVLRAVGEGLQAQERGLTFERDRALSLTLSAAGTRAQARAERASVATTALEPPTPGERTRAIYEEDPYR